MKPQQRDIITTPDYHFTIRMHEIPYFDVSWHTHPQYELIYILNSTGKRYVGDSVEPFKEDDMVFLGKGLPHCWLNAPLESCGGKDFGAKYIVMHFSQSFLDSQSKQGADFQQLIDLLSRSSRGLHFDKKVSRKVKGILFELIEAKGLSRIINFYRILNQLVEANNVRYLSGMAYSDKWGSDKSERISKIRNYVNNNLSQNISLEHVAAMVGMTPTSFCRFFKRQQKKTFMGYVSEMRISKACKLLLGTDLLIYQIMHECGYNNAANFYRQFKSITNKSPENYRQAYMG